MITRPLALIGLTVAAVTLLAHAQDPPAETAVELSGSDIDYQTLGDGKILLRGMDSDLDILQALIERIDSETDRLTIELITLKNGSAVDMAARVEQLFRNVYPNEEISIVADEGSNSLIVAAPVERMPDIVDLATQLDDKTPVLELEFKIVQLEYIPASEAATLLMTALEQAVLQSPSGAKIIEKIKIIPIDRNSTLNVTAPQEYLEQIEALIKVYDVEPQGLAKAQLLYIPLVKANAQTLATALEEMLSVQGQQAEALKEKILRLRFTKVGVDGSLQPLPELDLEKPIKIVAEEGTNALIIATHDQNAEALREIVQLLDNVPILPGIGIEFFPLKYADAESVAEILRNMFDSGKTLPETPGQRVKDAVPSGIPGEALVYNVSIHADKRANTIVVSGRAEQVALAHTVIKQLDIEGRTFFPKTEFLYLEHSDPERVALILTQLNTAAVESLTAREAGTAAIEKERALVVHDLQANALVIMATEEKFAELADLARKLDTAPVDQAGNIQIIPCGETLSAIALAPKIVELWGPKGEERTRMGLPANLPVIVPDERSNALVVAAGVEDFRAIRSVVTELESQPLSKAAMIRLIPIVNNDATQLADMLKQIFDARLEQRGSTENDSDKVALVADSGTNTLLVAASPENYGEIQRIVKELDVIPELEGVIQSFVLKHADAANVESKIRELVIDQGIWRPGVSSEGAVADARDRVAMIADARSNAIMVSASKPNMAIIEQLIGRMDSSDLIDLGATRVFAITHVDALKVADILTQVFDGLEQAAGSSSEEFIKPSFIPVSGSNALIVTGSRDAMVRTEDLLVRIDMPSESPSAQFEVYTLENASCVQVAPKVQEMFDERSGGGGDGADRTPVHIQAVEGSNSLLVSAAREDHELLKRLVGMLDIKSRLNQQLRIFNLASATAENTATVLNELFQSQGDSSAQGPVNAIAVQPVPWTNSILVWASAGQMEDIEAMIAKIDANEPDKEMRLEIVQLRQAMAEDLAEALNTVLEGNDGSGTSAEVAIILSFFEERSNGEAELRELLRQDITIVPYAQTNALLVMAAPNSAQTLRSLIQKIDDLKPPSAIVEVFSLRYANAEQMISTLETIFENQESGSSSANGPETVISSIGDIAPALAGAEGGVMRSLTFAPDIRTNSVIVAGNEQYITIVGDLIRKLDGESADERIMEVVRLSNGEAENMATIMQTYNQQENERLSVLDEARSAYQLADQALNVVPDPTTNSVIMGMSPRFRDQYLGMVKDLDRAPEQVLIEFMLIEVALDDLFELGVEFAAQDLLFSEKAFTGPNGTVKGPEFDFVAGTDLGAAGSGGGFSFSMTGEDFSFLFHALQTAGRAELISRPSLLVEDNAEDARIAILNSVPTLRSLGADNAGNAVTNIEYIDAGITLQVTPHINPDGFIQMEIDSQVTSVGPPIQVGGTSSVSIQGTELTTTVTVKDGETVIIGGLIESAVRNTESKVPWFGDLPGVGQLFRSNSESASRRELLVVITTTVVRSQEDAYRMSVEQRDKTGIIPDRVKQDELMNRLRVEPSYELDEEPIRQRDMLRDDEDYGPRPTSYGPRRPAPASPNSGADQVVPVSAPATPRRPDYGEDPLRHAVVEQRKRPWWAPVGE